MGIMDIFAKLGGLGDPSATPAVAPAPAPAAALAAAPAAPPVPGNIAQDMTPGPSTAAGVDMVSDKVDPQPGGLGGLLGHIAGTMNDENPATGSSLVDRLGLLGAHIQDNADGGDRATAIQKRMDDSQAANEKAQRNLQLTKMAADLKLPPVQMMMFRADPQAWLAAHPEYGTPKMVGDQAHGFGTQTLDGFTPTSAGVRTPAEIQAAADKAAALAETTRHNQATEATGKINAGAHVTAAGAAATRANKPAAGGIGAFDPKRFTIRK